MNSIVIFGAGNVATHLFRAFSEANNFSINQVYNHREEGLKFFSPFCKTTTNLTEVEQADIYIIAVKDDAIPSITESFKFKNALVLHTSGAVSLEVFGNIKRGGSFYPLQTFSKSKPLDFKKIPICIEAKDEADIPLIESLAGSISDSIFRINSEQRKYLHLAAVYVNNFVNHLYAEGEKLCQTNNIPFQILQPLIEETAAKLTLMSPKDAQTGPAKRNDLHVIETHLSLLDQEQQNIYKLITQSIQELHGKKL